MPSATCTKCNATTNSATSNYWMPTDGNGDSKEIGVVTMCYAAFDEENDKWIKGCSYDQCPRQNVVDKLLAFKEEPVN